MKKKLLAGLATVLFLLTSTGIAIAGDDAKNKTESNNSKATGLYDNVTILQEQINSLTERLGRIETLHEAGDRFTHMGDGTIRDNSSGLIWLKDANCGDFPYTDAEGRANWENATAASAALNHGTCGLTDGSEKGDWRLPTKAEWEAFMSDVYEDPTLVNTVGDGQWAEGDAFTQVLFDREVYWSSTKNEIYESFAYTAFLRDGIISNTSTIIHVAIWPVRTGTENRFTDMGDGTIRDNVSGLIWLKKANCFEWTNWSDAMAAAALLADGQCGLTDLSNAGDWRLPTKAEWGAFMSDVYEDPALVNTRGDGQWAEGDAFTGLSMWDVNIFWSKSEALAGAAWIALVDGGGVGPSSHVNPWGVWPVRSVNW
jgi:hypothetical protein